MHDPQVQHLQVTAPMRTSFGQEMLYITPPVQLERTPGRVAAPAPEWGEHTDEVLREAGYSEVDIDAFHEQGVV
jgi:crotonobetainyl-CoA:carnitine CoA-transferase CaiB-like acyl-CoA transferase